jgi:hypothetical protein
MKRMIKKLIKVVAYVALAIIVFGLVIRIANGVRFVTAKPDGTDEYNYIGSWESENALLVAGRILAKIPYPPPKGESFTVKAYVYYNMIGLYRPGRFVPMDMEGFIQESGDSLGSNSANPIILPHQITFKFKGNRGPRGKQTIDYVSTSDSEFTQVAGGYRSHSPYDIGCFRIKKVR